MMGRSPANNNPSVNPSTGFKKGQWSSEEDEKLIAYIRRYGIWNWNHMAKPAGLMRSGKSCRLRWLNYLRPNIRHGNFTGEEIEAIIKWHKLLGNKWTKIAEKLPGRTDNEVKNYWNSRLKKRIVTDELSNPATNYVSETNNNSASQATSDEIDVPNAASSSNSRNGSYNSSMDEISSCGENEYATSMIASPRSSSFWDELHLPTLVDISMNLDDDISEFTRVFLSNHETVIL